MRGRSPSCRSGCACADAVKLDSARALKRSLLAAPVVFASFDEAPRQPLPVALGIAGTARSFRLAVRIHTPFPGIAGWLDRVRAVARGEVDVRVVGPVRAQAVPWRVRLLVMPLRNLPRRR